MTVAAVLVGVAAVVLAAAGFAKLLDPRPAARAVVAMTGFRIGFQPARGIVRALGVLEVVVSGSALVLDGPGPIWALSAMYLVFAVVVVAALRAGVDSCGCFGSRSAPPSLRHVVVNLVASVLTAGAAWVVGSASAVTVLADGPWGGVPLVVVVAVGAGVVMWGQTS